MPAGWITGLQGVDLGVTDVAAARRFYTEVWRLSPVAERDGSVYLRGSGAYHHVLSLHRRPRPELLRINLAAADRSAVDAVHANVARTGAKALVPPAESAEPGGGYAFSFADPEGRVVRVVAGGERHADAAATADRPIKITHIVLNTP